MTDIVTMEINPTLNASKFESDFDRVAIKQAEKFNREINRAISGTGIRQLKVPPQLVTQPSQAFKARGALSGSTAVAAAQIGVSEAMFNRVFTKLGTRGGILGAGLTAVGPGGLAVGASIGVLLGIKKIVSSINDRIGKQLEEMSKTNPGLEMLIDMQKKMFNIAMLPLTQLMFAFAKPLFIFQLGVMKKALSEGRAKLKDIKARRAAGEDISMEDASKEMFDTLKPALEVMAASSQQMMSMLKPVAGFIQGFTDGIRIIFNTWLVGIGSYVDGVLLATTSNLGGLSDKAKEYVVSVAGGMDPEDASLLPDKIKGWITSANTAWLNAPTVDSTIGLFKNNLENVSDEYINVLRAEVERISGKKNPTSAQFLFEDLGAFGQGPTQAPGAYTLSANVEAWNLAVKSAADASGVTKATIEEFAKQLGVSKEALAGSGNFTSALSQTTEKIKGTEGVNSALDSLMEKIKTLGNKTEEAGRRIDSAVGRAESAAASAANSSRSANSTSSSISLLR